jgi:tetratricopeptide (TPR) repeat protein
MCETSRLLTLAMLLLSMNGLSVVTAQDKSPDLTRAQQLLDTGKTDEALTLLKQISLRDPNRKGLARELGVAYYKKSDFAQALPYLRQAHDEDRDDKEAIQLLGLSYYFTGKTADAIPLLERTQSWYRVANVDALYVLGLCYLSTENYDSARKAFAAMFDIPLDSAASYLFTGRMLVRQEIKPLAEQYLQKAIALDSKLPLAHYLLGELYLSESKTPEAIGELQKEIAINPGFAGAYYRLADAQRRVEKYDEAERLLQRSIWLDPTSTGPYILLGQVLEKKGETELAARTLQRVLTMDPNNPVPHYLLGQAYQRMGRTKDADREFKMSEQLRQRAEGDAIMNRD